MSHDKEPEMKMSFNKGYTPQGFAEKVYHLHVRYHGDWNELYFRDYLSEHSEVAAEYARLKQSLSKKYEHDRDGYTNAKAEFILKYTMLARESYCDRYLPKKQADWSKYEILLEHTYGSKYGGFPKVL